MSGLLVPLPSWPTFGSHLDIFPYLGPDTFRSVEGMALSYRDLRARNLLILVPAGECVDESEDRLAGQRDTPLSVKGRAQAIAAGRALKAVFNEKGCHALFSSKMRRATQTLDLFCQAAGLNVGGIDDDLETRSAAALNDRALGRMEGKTNSILRDEYGAELLDLYRTTLMIAPPGGESLGNMMNNRVGPYLERAILPSVTGSRTRVAVIVAGPDALRAIDLSLSKRRTQDAIAKASMRPGGPPRVITVDRTGKYIAAEEVDLPPLPPLRNESNESTRSLRDDLPAVAPAIYVAAPTLAGSSKQTIEEHADVFHDAKAEVYIPITGEPVSIVKGSRFVEDLPLDPRVRVPGKAESLRTLRMPMTVNEASAYHGTPLASTIRLAA